MEYVSFVQEYDDNPDYEYLRILADHCAPSCDEFGNPTVSDAGYHICKDIREETLDEQSKLSLQHFLKCRDVISRLERLHLDPVKMYYALRWIIAYAHEKYDDAIPYIPSAYQQVMQFVEYLEKTGSTLQVKVKGKKVLPLNDPQMLSDVSAFIKQEAERKASSDPDYNSRIITSLTESQPLCMSARIAYETESLQWLFYAAKESITGSKSRHWLTISRMLYRLGEVTEYCYWENDKAIKGAIKSYGEKHYNFVSRTRLE